MEALNVLVVEDNAIVAELLSELLIELGHSVCAIEATAEGAVSAADRYKPDLIIIDSQLRRGDGVAAMERVLRVRHIPHVFVSGNVAYVLALRPDAVALQKPYTEATLLGAMELALAASHKP